jgi:hypothetical protein
VKNWALRVLVARVVAEGNKDEKTLAWVKEQEDLILKTIGAKA